MGLVAILLIAVGIWDIISPKGALDFKAKIAKSMGAKLTPTKKTYAYTRYMGIGFIILGLLILFY